MISIYYRVVIVYHRHLSMFVFNGEWVIGVIGNTYIKLHYLIYNCFFYLSSFTNCIVYLLFNFLFYFCSTSCEQTIYRDVYCVNVAKNVRVSILDEK